MIELPPAWIAALHDPLVVTLCVFFLLGLAGHLLFRRRPLGRALVRVVFLGVLTIVLLRAGIVPYQPLVLTGAPLEDAAHAALKIAWWAWAARFVVGVLRVFVASERRQHEGKLVQDLLAGLIYLAAFFAIISYVFNLPIEGLLATSGAIAIIVGLALQSTLGDVFSGVVLNFSRPYRPGDWISIDGGTEGRVIEMNWRATHVLTAKRDLAIVPNSTIAKAKIVNASSPTGIHGMTVTVRLGAGTPPAVGAEILQLAILNTRLIMATPDPLIRSSRSPPMEPNSISISSWRNSRSRPALKTSSSTGFRGIWQRPASLSHQARARLPGCRPPPSPTAPRPLLNVRSILLTSFLVSPRRSGSCSPGKPSTGTTMPARPWPSPDRW